MHKTTQFKPYFLTITKITKPRMEKCRVKQVRILSFTCQPYEVNNSYYFPKKESLKYLKKLSLEFSSNTGDIMGKVLRYFKHTKPTKFSISTESIFKLIDKLGILRHLDFFSNLNHLVLRIENSLFDGKVAAFLSDWVFRSPNVKNLVVSIERGSAIEDSIVGLFSNLGCLQKVEKFVLRTPFTSVSDRELQALAENSLVFMDKIRNLVIETNGNKNLSDLGLAFLSKALLPKLHIESFDLNIQGTGVDAGGLSSLLQAFENNHNIQTFTLRMNDVPHIEQILCPFFEQHQNLKNLILDFTNSSKIEEEILRTIQEKVSSLPALEKYTLNASGCHALRASGTYYLPESLGLFSKLKELSIHFANFLDHESGDRCVVSLDENIPKLANLEGLFLDFNNCTEWFVESRNGLFFGQLGLLQNLKRLNLNLRKTTIDSTHIGQLLESLTKIKNLTHIELDVSFCKNLDDKDIRGLLITLPSALPLEDLTINADDCRYTQNMLFQDLQAMIKASKTLKSATISMKKNLNKREGLTLMASIEKTNPYFNLNVIGGKTFTVVKPVTMGGISNTRKSRFGSAQQES